MLSSGGKGRESAPFALLEGFSIKGTKTFARDCRVCGDTPASVRSPHAPARSPKPCRNITIDTTSPKGGINLRYNIQKEKDLPPMGSRGNAGKIQVPKMAKNATRLE